MLVIVGLAARALLVLVSVCGIGICCGTAFLCFGGMGWHDDGAVRVQMAIYGTISVLMTCAFTWMLLNVGSLP